MLTQNILCINRVLFLVAALSVFSCADKAPTRSGDAGEEELITTVTLTFTPQGGGPAVTIQSRDLDGDGGNPPTVDTLKVTLGTTYDGMILIQNEAATPVENISDEIKNEAEEHQFFYTPGGGFVSASITVTDKESDYGANAGADLPVGLTFTLTVPNHAGPGTLRVILSHFGDVAKNGISQSIESDIDITFNAMVQ